MLSGNYSNFQIPNNPGQPTAFVVNGRDNFNSAKLDENQAENSAYGILTYQKNPTSSTCRHRSSLVTAASCFGPMRSAISFSMESLHASTARSHKRLRARHELQAERSKHAPGWSALHRLARNGRKSTLVFPVDAAGNQTSDVPFRIVDNSSLNGYFAGFYLQDEWKPFEQLTINFGGRLDLRRQSRRKVNSARA